MAQPMLLKLVSYDKIAKSEEGFVLVTKSGDTILLGDMPQLEETTTRIEILPDRALLNNQVLLAAFYYDRTSHRLLAQPLSIITDNQIVRLLY